jgi:hypothetical protein
MFNDKGNGIWHAVFNACANSLQWTAAKLNKVTPGGMDYVKINVLIFCVVLPIVLLVSLGLNVAFLMGLL